MNAFRFKSIIHSALPLAALFFAAAPAFAQMAEKKACLAYEPAVVIVIGRLVRRTVVDASGRRQTIWIVRLAAPTCVNADPKNEMNAAVGRIAEMQLVLTAGQIGRYRTAVNQKIELRGTLFAAHTQHHFTEVLLTVETARKR